MFSAAWMREIMRTGTAKQVQERLCKVSRFAHAHAAAESGDKSTFQGKKKKKHLSLREVSRLRSDSILTLGFQVPFSTEGAAILDGSTYRLFMLQFILGATFLAV